jgi:uncharacterized membrane protein YdjX (TVP38/TMEM64 family)
MWLRVAALLVLGGGLAVPFLIGASLDAAMITDHIDDWPMLMPVVFLLAHVAASLMWVPRTMMALAAGLLFGLGWGMAWSMVGSMAGATACFVLARHLFADAAALGERKRIGPWIARAESGGWWFVALLRLVPLVPHTLSNYALGVTRLSLGAYLAGSFVGMLPLSFVYVNLGQTGRSGLAGGEWVVPVVVALVLVAIMAIVPRLMATRLRAQAGR